MDFGQVCELLQPYSPINYKYKFIYFVNKNKLIVKKQTKEIISIKAKTNITLDYKNMLIDKARTNKKAYTNHKKSIEIPEKCLHSFF